MNATSQNSLNLFQKDSKKSMRDSINASEGKFYSELSKKIMELNTGSLSQ